MSSSTESIEAVERPMTAKKAKAQAKAAKAKANYNLVPAPYDSHAAVTVCAVLGLSGPHWTA